LVLLNKKIRTPQEVVDSKWSDEKFVRLVKSLFNLLVKSLFNLLVKSPQIEKQSISNSFELEASPCPRYKSKLIIWIRVTVQRSVSSLRLKFIDI
jgi:hypothetical protein